MSKKQKNNDTEMEGTGRSFPFALLIPVFAVLVLGLGSAGTFAGVRARRHEQERDGLPALLAMVPAGALAIAGLLGIAALRRRHDHEALVGNDATDAADLPAGLDA